MSDPRVDAVVVHFRSGGMLLDVLADLEAQEGVALAVHVVECGDDGTVERARAAGHSFTLHGTGANLGYAGGNNLAFEALASSGADVLVVNPDARLADGLTVRTLVDALASAPTAAAVAPVVRDPDHGIEYQDSEVDLVRARAVHTETWRPAWSAPGPTRAIDWLDGACLLVRAAALREVGGFDERYFLIAEEVDWCLRARAAGWDLLLVRDAVVTHRRSASFTGSTKSAYYATRNTYRLMLDHSPVRRWRWWWAVATLRTAARRDHLTSRRSRRVLQGARDAVLGRWGPAPEDR